jgi:predicted O-methyltransferase YrrM
MWGIYRITRVINPSFIVEIGVREGFSTVAFLRATENKVISFDPVFVGNKMFNTPLKQRWDYHQLFDYEAYEKFSEELRDIEFLYIDVAPHDYEQTVDILKKNFILNLKKGGYLLLDDCSPLHQEEVKEIPEALWDANAGYGTLRATLEFIEENDSRIEYAFSIQNNHSNGLLLIKFKE